jgi:hypothetical protein
MKAFNLASWAVFLTATVDIATGIPDSQNGRFEITGLAQQYMHYGELTRTVTWAEGEYATTMVEGPSPETAAR